jgi:hypothetical protein
VSAPNSDPGHAIDCGDRITEAVNLVTNRKLKRRVDVGTLVVTADVQVVMVPPAVSQPMNHPGIGMEIKMTGLSSVNKLSKSRYLLKLAVTRPLAIKRLTGSA